ncbi:MAG: LON peptidase substrate-binding domain-containing protein [Bdellovibrionales bacterium]|nr:LON peptidase substrate-binding domain-containing protein [Bdellovibrionales bacterium]
MSSFIEACFFPLEGVVFFPSATLPLNIFEPRYLSMTDYALKNQIPIALSDLDPTEPGTWGAANPLITGIGTAHHFEQRPDGTRIILVRGSSRARVVSILQEKPFIRCQIETLKDATLVRERNQFFLQRLRQGLGKWAEETLPDADSKTAFQASLVDPHRLVELYSHYRLQDVDIRQQLLEIDDVNARIELLRRVI